MSRATKSYEQGDIILKSVRPFAVAILTDHRHETCAYCLSIDESKLKRCANCFSISYCTKECQRADWTSGPHKYECAGLAKLVQNKTNGKLSNDSKNLPVQLDPFLLPLRLVLLLHHKPQLVARHVQLHSGGLRSMGDLLSHEQDFEQDSQAKREFNEFLRLLKRMELTYLIDSEANKELVWRTFCKDKINSVNVTDPMERLLGEALYLDLSIFDHSCLPNAAHIFINGLELQLRAMTTIKEGDDIHINYIPLELSLGTRRATLLDRYKFTCRCVRCTQTTIKMKSDESITKQLQVIRKKMCQQPKDTDRLEVYKLFERFVGLLSEIVPVPHPVRSLSHFTGVMDIFQTYLNDSNSQTSRLTLKQSDKMFIRELNDQLRVTHGVDHQLYRLYLTGITKLSHLLRD